MTIKKTILVLALIGAGLYGLHSCSCDNKRHGLAENKSMIEKLVEDKKISPEIRDRTLDEFVKYVRDNPSEMKSYVLDISEIGLKSDYRREIWDRLSKEEKWGLVKEVSEYKGNEFLGEVKDLSQDAYEKFKQTKLYDKLTNERGQK